MKYTITWSGYNKYTIKLWVMTLTKFENGAAKNNIVVTEHKSPTWCTAAS